jgi:hypothetical protein
MLNKTKNAMKKLFYLPMILAFGLFFSACEKDNFFDEAVELNGRGRPATASIPDAPVPIPAPDCAEVCFELDADGLPLELFPMIGSNDIVSGINTARAIYEVWNDLENFYVKVTFDVIAGPANGKADITVTLLGDENSEQTETEVDQGTFRVFTFPLENVSTCDEMEFNILVSGVGENFIEGLSYSIIGVCNDGCEESFYWIDNEDGSFTFRFISDVDLTDAEVVFTFAQGTYIVGLDGFDENGATMQKTMDFTACELVEWTVFLSPNCSGNSPNSNVWTDFKINGGSKKGELENIVLPCN